MSNLTYRSPTEFVAVLADQKCECGPYFEDGGEFADCIEAEAPREEWCWPCEARLCMQKEKRRRTGKES